MEFARWFRTGEITFKHAKGMRDVIGQEMHPYHELFLFLGGDAEFISDQGKEKLRPMTTVVIPRGSFHQFVVHGPEAEYTRCVLNFDRVAELDELIECKLGQVYLTRNEKVAQLFWQMHPLAEAEDRPEARILLKALFAQLLVSLCEDEAPDPIAFHPLTVSAIAYIAERPGKRIRLDRLAAALHASPSRLSHVFKADVRISLSRYMLEKRLILAHQMIVMGSTPQQAAWACGFEDYSSFYRQYRKMFGLCPSASFSK